MRTPRSLARPPDKCCEATGTDCCVAPRYVLICPREGNEHLVRVARLCGQGCQRTATRAGNLMRLPGDKCLRAGWTPLMN